MALLAMACGCSKPKFDLVNVSGSVKYADGTVPECGVHVVRFEPVVPPDGRTSAVAVAQVQADGTFQLTTVKPADGAMPGDYKVGLLFWNSVADRTEILPSAYGSAATTPLPIVSVARGKQNHFDLIVDRRPRN